VQEPLDLTTIIMNCYEDKYGSIEEFNNEMSTLFNNFKHFNTDGSQDYDWVVKAENLYRQL